MDRIRRLTLPLAQLLAAASPAPSAEPPPAPPTLGARNHVLIEAASGQTLAENGADERAEPASLTKMMTAYLAFKELKAGRVKLDTPVTISENAWRHGAKSDGSVMFVEVGKQVPFEALLMGMIVQSGNDATLAIAEHLGGSEAAFAQRMNEQAQALGMKNTHFVNAHGLPAPEHYTTARDMALLGRALIRDFPDYYKWHAVSEYTWHGITQYNRNVLLRKRELGVDGIKTGHTKSAGFCLAASALRDNLRLVSVVMGTKSEKARAQDTEALLNYGFRHFENRRLYPAGEKIAEPRVWKGLADKLALGAEGEVALMIPRGQYEQIKADIEAPKSIVAPIEKGQRLGMLRVRLNEKLLLEQPLVALEAVEAAGFFRRAVDSVRLWFE
jgi:D-alanyl-D-alanine carboxypeptidase (penicillin-binding protein 5/6)